MTDLIDLNDEISSSISIQDEMKQSFMDYAMSVIVSRALPDVRDGLKPVHRRILFAMHEMRMTPDKPFKKSARIVGEVLGKYHPHGDTAVYDAMVRMAQEFSTRYLLVDGQGNFGSVDGDSPAAMRYTEARLTKVAMEILKDLDCETVNFTPNFDGSLEEPSVMPGLLPNLLLNGCTGIAVGMATEIPPHNLGELVDALIYLVDNPEASIDDLMQFVQGPDFPTGGILMGQHGIREAYHTGRGGVILRSVVEVEEGQKGERDRLIVKEIPYQLNKTRLIEQIAESVQIGKIEGIADLRDESDRNGMRINIELKRDAIPQVVLNNLYQHTRLQGSYNFNMVGLVDYRPRLLNLKEILEEYLKHRGIIIRRRTQFFLRNAQDRAHIVAGLLIVLSNLDEVIRIIRKAQSSAEAQQELTALYSLSDKQASAIMDMQLRRLTGLEFQKLENENKELTEKITNFQGILADDSRVQGIIQEELRELASRFRDKRRTQLQDAPGAFRNEDLIPDEPMVIFMTQQGYIKRLHLDSFEEQKRGGRGVAGIQTRDADFIRHFAATSSHGTLLFFTNRGVVYSMKAYEIPETSRQAKGNSIANLLELREGEAVTAVIPVTAFEGDFYLTMLTRKGIIKKTPLQAFRNIRRMGLIAVGLDEDDVLGWVKMTDGQQNLIIGTERGMAIQFNETKIRPMGRSARGVIAIKLKGDDKVIGMDTFLPGQALLSITSNGYGKRTNWEEYRLQGRSGHGLINMKLRKNGRVASILAVKGSEAAPNPLEQIVVVTSSGVVIRMVIDVIPTYSRLTKGVTIQKLSSSDKIVAVAPITATEEDMDEVDVVDAIVVPAEEADDEDDGDLLDQTEDLSEDATPEDSDA